MSKTTNGDDFSSAASSVDEAPTEHSLDDVPAPDEQEIVKDYDSADDKTPSEQSKEDQELEETVNSDSSDDDEYEDEASSEQSKDDQPSTKKSPSLIPVLIKDVIVELIRSKENTRFGPRPSLNNFDSILKIALASKEGLQAFNDVLEQQQPLTVAIKGWNNHEVVVELKEGRIHTTKFPSALWNLSLPFMNALVISNMDQQLLINSLPRAISLNKFEATWCDLFVDTWEAILLNSSVRNVAAYHLETLTIACMNANFVLEQFEYGFLGCDDDFIDEKLVSIIRVPCKALKVHVCDSRSRTQLHGFYAEAIRRIRYGVISSSIQELEMQYFGSLHEETSTVQALQHMLPNLKKAKIVVFNYANFPWNFVHRVQNQIENAEINFELDFAYHLHVYEGIYLFLIAELVQNGFAKTDDGADVKNTLWIYEKQITPTKKLTFYIKHRG